MCRFLILVFAAVTCTFLSSPVQASGDYGCTPQWRVVQYENGGCNNSAILGPGNDTRVNLLLLMQDFYPDGKGAQSTGIEPLFEWRSLRDNLYYQKPKNDGIFREHTRCGSNSDGAMAFEKAVKAAKNLTASERDALINARKIFEPECGGGMREIPFRIVLDGIKTDTAKEFRDYLRAAIIFYDGDFDAAQIAFAALSKAKSDWVRETAQYMLARNALNQAQDNAFDEWGYFDGTRKRDVVALEKARERFQSYLKNWPKGRYAYSARSLMRRVYWLGNEPAKLAAEYRWHLGAISFGQAEDLGRTNQAALAEEIDSKLLPRNNGGSFGGRPAVSGRR